jgi:mannose-1-phosphate guanylyltransferase
MPFPTIIPREPFMTESSAAPVAVIMAGGSGTRFWPVSRAKLPKQLVSLLGGPTMIQATVARLQPLIPAERVLVITTAAQAEETRCQLPMLKPEHVIAEPVGRDTAACVALAALIIAKDFPGAPMILLPADQVIDPADRFQAALAAGVEQARQGRLVTFGITPRFAATGYGYVEVAEELGRDGAIGINRVARFVEKPNAARAAEYLASGRFRWNAGIFAWRTDVALRELAAHTPWLIEAMTPVGAAWGTPGFAETLAAAYGPLQKISIDYALLEKAKDIAVVTADFIWDDLGSWDALYDHLPTDANDNRVSGEVLTIGSHGNLAVNRSGQTLALVGVENISVITTQDAILVVARNGSQEVKKVVELLATTAPKCI